MQGKSKFLTSIYYVKKPSSPRYHRNRCFGPFDMMEGMKDSDFTTEYSKFEVELGANVLHTLDFEDLTRIAPPLLQNTPLRKSA
jgi:hypothetical protein